MLQVLGKVSGVEENVSQCKSECMCWGELVWLKDEVEGLLITLSWNGGVKRLDVHIQMSC